MFGSVILDIAIGMILVFLMLSLVCSAINEIIEAYLNRRAAFLEQGIRDLLEDADQNARPNPPGDADRTARTALPITSGETVGTDQTESTDADGPTSRLYNHPLISALIENRRGERFKPSYIPARNFALALMDIMAPAENNQRSGSTNATVSQRIQAVDAPAAADGVTSRPAPVPSQLETVREAVATTANPQIKRALLPLIDAAGDDAAKVRENIEYWFNSAMDKVSGAYKRRTQKIILLIGFAVAALLNADSIAISNKLWHDKPLREAIVAAAQEAAKNNPSAIVAANAPAPPPGASPASAPADKPIVKCTEVDKKGLCGAACRADAASPECRFDVNMKRIEELGLPIGWQDTNLFRKPADLRGGGILFWDWLMKIVGLLMTAFAVSLGAPFWFDLLNKFIVVRSTVKPREKSREEHSKE